MPSATLWFFVGLEVAQLLGVDCIFLGAPVMKDVALRHKLIKWNSVSARLFLMTIETASARCCKS